MRRDRTRFLAAVMAAALAAAMTSAAQPDPERPAAEDAAPAAAPTSLRQPPRDGGGSLRVGGTVDAALLHPVTRPGLYGMSQPPAGSRYGIIAGQLIRYDPDSVQVLSIIRQVDRILD
ncbi:hypothetical protein [Paracoccus aminovorans]|uniref:hypothetical protein n=1 Tax=Paracoccus aminovorans TaxID=34004 RepID=UPI000A66717D|nr:hypothetical protein [Paracoccus aminovorans]